MKSDYQILIVDDDEAIRQMLGLVLGREGFQISFAVDGVDALEKFSASSPDIVLMDIRMPRLDGVSAMQEMLARRGGATVILMTAFAELETAVRAIKLGVFDYLVKPFDLAEVSLLIDRAYQMREMRREISVLRRELSENALFGRLLTADAKMKALCNDVARLAQTNATVLVNGESGVGKELIAASIHYLSPRAAGPFIKINCGAMPEGLLESELFGHEKGAFTGAVSRRIGCFERAQGGTLFLDEVGEMSPALQVRLLRTLQEREIQRVGGNSVIAIDVRIIAATHRDLAAMVGEGSFRNDLFYRLNVVSVDVPPLRQRPADIPLLAGHFLEKFNLEHGKDVAGFDDHALALLQRYPWPGNVRELANAVERAVVMCTGRIVLADDLPATIARRSGGEVEAPAAEVPSGRSLKELVRAFEANTIAQVLARQHGNRSRAARELDISRRSLLYKIQELGLDSGDCAE